MSEGSSILSSCKGRATVGQYEITSNQLCKLQCRHPLHKLHRSSLSNMHFTCRYRIVSSNENKVSRSLQTELSHFLCDT